MPFTIPNEAAAAFPAQAGLYSADLDILSVAPAGTGVVSGCAVTAQGTPNMTVAVASGVVRSLRRQWAVTGANATITANANANPRFDLVVITSAGAIAVRAGTAAAAPLLPALTVGDVALAAVYVEANDTAIAANQINDRRMGVVNVGPWIDAIYDFGVPTDGTTDIGARLMDALDEGLPVFLRNGHYVSSQITMPHGAVLQGVNSGTYNDTLPGATAFGPTTQTRIMLLAGQNTSLIRIPSTSMRTHIRDMQFDGNKGNQTIGTASVLHFEAYTQQNESQAVLERCFTQNGRGSGVWVDGWRQAVHIRDHVSNFNAEFGVRVDGTDCVVDAPILGDNGNAGMFLAGNVTIVKGGAIYNNGVGILLYDNVKGVKIIGTGIDKNLKQGIYGSIGSDSIAVLGCTFTSNGRSTAEAGPWPHIQVASTAGGFNFTGNSFRTREPGTLYDKLPNYAIQLDPGASAIDAGNTFVAAGHSVGYTNAAERLYSSARMTFRESMNFWSSDLTGTTPPAEHGLNLPAAVTELDATFGGTRRTLTLEETGRQCMLSARFRCVALASPTTAMTLRVSIRDTSNTANELCFATAVINQSTVGNYEAVGAWINFPTWWTTGNKTFAVYTSGGDGADDFIFRDISLKWRG